MKIRIGKYIDRWIQLNKTSDLDTVEKEIESKKQSRNIIFVLHPENKTEFLNARENFF